MIYVDHAATTPLRPEAAGAMAPFLTGRFGNPSGLHGVSRQARTAVEDARERVAVLLGAAHPLDVVFTGGGTESDNLGVSGPALAGDLRGGVVTTAVEHEAVLQTGRRLQRLGCPLSVVGVDRNGVVDPAAIAERVDGATAVVSVMAANNETGVVQPVAEVAAAVRSHRAVVHCDAVQAIVSRPVTLDGLGVDLLTISAHKVGGPQGVGILALRPGIDLEPVLHGGGQEVGRRSGTHNVAGIVGAAAALEAAVADRPRFVAEVGEARDRFERRVAAGIPDVVFTLGGVDRLVQHSHLRVPGITAETLLVRLDGMGVAASAGSACHSGAAVVSPVLAAMGLSAAEASGSVRVTFGWTSTIAEAEAAAEAVVAAARGLR